MNSVTKLLLYQFAERSNLRAEIQRSHNTIAELKTALAQAKEWELAVDQQLVLWLATTDSFPNPTAAVRALISLEVMTALDPRVSSAAAALVEQGRQEERARHRKSLEAAHAEGVKEAALRCAKIAHRDSRVWSLIRAEYPEAFVPRPDNDNAAAKGE